MKSALIAGLLLSMNAFGVDSAKIENNFNFMCKFAKSCEIYEKLEGKTVKDLLTSLSTEIEGMEAEVVDSGDAAPGADDVVYGTLSMRGALNLVDMFVSQATLSEKQANVIKGQIKDLKGTGVEFGYTPNQGGVVCGVVFPSLLLIDTAKKKAYSVAMLGYPEC